MEIIFCTDFQNRCLRYRLYFLVYTCCLYSFENGIGDLNILISFIVRDLVRVAYASSEITGTKAYREVFHLVFLAQYSSDVSRLIVSDDPAIAGSCMAISEHEALCHLFSQFV